ncbi:hypothetical protein [Stenotrophomonas nitritireducens]|uniref:hypothetical protein n=1 Tax=Stenotrophomonas nitritireducens TaxID=83617 RepID=UPI003D97D5A4
MIKTIPCLLAMSLALSLCAGASAATPGLPAGLPGYAADKPLPVPDISRRTLGNGLEVWVVPRDGLPRVDYVLAMRDAGLAADAAATPGFASVLAQLLTAGTQAHDARQIAELAQGMGGSIGASASVDGLCSAARRWLRRPSRCWPCWPRSRARRPSPTTRWNWPAPTPPRN